MNLNFIGVNCIINSCVNLIFSSELNLFAFSNIEFIILSKFKYGENN